MEEPYRPRAERRTYTKPEPLPTIGLTIEWQRWLEQRGITPIVWERNGLTTEGTKLAFPYLKSGELVNTKYRTTDKHFTMVTDAELIPYGWDDCERQERVIVVEGEMDKLAIEVATGYTFVTSPPNGATPNDSVLEYLCRLCESASQVVLAGDMDEAGRTFQEKLAERIGLHRCWRVTWPVKDANETLMQFGEAAVRSAIADAKPYPVEGIFTLSDVWDAYEALYFSGRPPGLKVGWYQMDQCYSVKTKQLTTVTGAPSFGKSTWLSNYLVRLCDHHGWRIALCSPESASWEDLAAKLAQMKVGKPFGDDRWATAQRMSPEEMRSAGKWVDDHFYALLPAVNTIDNILERARVLKERFGINGLVIDPVNTIEAAKQPGQTPTEYIHQWTAKVRGFMTDHDLHVWLVAHPSKVLNARRDREGRIPVATPYDIADSAAFYNRSDNILSVWRDPKNPAMGCEVHVQKIRHDEIGREGMVVFDFDRPTTRFTERLR